jgi:hypothetical protein
MKNINFKKLIKDDNSAIFKEEYNGVRIYKDIEKGGLYIHPKKGKPIVFKYGTIEQVRKYIDENRSKFY